MTGSPAGRTGDPSDGPGGQVFRQLANECASNAANLKSDYLPFSDWVAELFEHRHLFVCCHLAAAQRSVLQSLLRYMHTKD